MLILTVLHVKYVSIFTFYTDGTPLAIYLVQALQKTPAKQNKKTKIKNGGYNYETRKKIQQRI